jgi:two-component system, sensor histidine kinase LadS
VAARYLLVAWATIEVATFVTTLAGMGIIEAPGWEHAQHFGFVVETVLLSIALADRIKRERESKEAAERQSLELGRTVELERDEKIRAQAHALEVQRLANEELELRVVERTAELERAMEKVELANRELAQLSVTDALTKVHNRRYFDETIKKEYDRSARSGTPLSLMLIDIDYFKRINDSVGHLAGDECLKLVASALAASVGRSTDLVARYGGEEFAVVLPATEHVHALEVAERIRQAVQDIQFIYRGQRVPVSVSLGVVARAADAARPLAEFISEADEALYAAKGAGRNRVMLAA